MSLFDFFNTRKQATSKNFYGEVQYPVEREPDPVKAAYISGEKNVLDELGLTKARAAMDKAHNDMLKRRFAYIEKIVDAKKQLVTDQETRQRAVDPFSDDNGAYHFMTDEELQEEIRNARKVLHTSSFVNEDYRSAAVLFLEAVVPAVQNREKELQEAVNAARVEYYKTMKDLRDKIQAAESERNLFRGAAKNAIFNGFENVESCSGYIRTCEAFEPESFYRAGHFTVCDAGDEAEGYLEYIKREF